MLKGRAVIEYTCTSLVPKTFRTSAHKNIINKQHRDAPGPIHMLNREMIEEKKERGN